MNKDSGYSLLLVVCISLLITFFVVSGLTVAVSNYNMKKTERDSSENFYYAEMVLNDIKNGVISSCKDIAKETYSTIVSYSSTIPIEKLDYEFKKLYCNNIMRYYSDLVSTLSDYSSLGFSFLKEPYIESSVDFGGLVIKDICIEVSVDGVYNSVIGTNIAIDSPSILSVCGNEDFIINDYKKYCLIADRGIVVDNTVGINGNIYSGSDIQVGYNSNCRLCIRDGVVHTRGSFNIHRGASLICDDVSLYSEGISTLNTGCLSEPSSSYTAIDFDGDAYISKDLSLNIPYGNVKFSGEYYGYTPEESMIKVNTSNVNLILDKLYLAGYKEESWGRGSLILHYADGENLVPGDKVYRESTGECLGNPIEITDIDDYKVDMPVYSITNNNLVYLYYRQGEMTDMCCSVEVNENNSVGGIPVGINDKVVQRGISSSNYLYLRCSQIGKDFKSLNNTLRRSVLYNDTDSLFSSIIDSDLIESQTTFSLSNSKFTCSDAVYYSDEGLDVLVVDGDVSIRSSFEGIVIATGKIKVIGDVVIKGCLLSGSVIDFSLSNNSSLSTLEGSLENMEYLMYFKQSRGSSNDIINIDATVTFEEWYTE